MEARNEAAVLLHYKCEVEDFYFVTSKPSSQFKRSGSYGGLISVFVEFVDFRRNGEKHRKSGRFGFYESYGFYGHGRTASIPHSL